MEKRQPKETGGIMNIEWDIEELAYMAMGKTEKETEAAINDGDIDESIFEKYDTSFDIYCEIVKDLLPFTPKIKAGISGNIYHAFVIEENGSGRAIVKSEPKKLEGE